MSNRRRFLVTSAAGALSLGAPVTARAFRLVEPAPEVLDAYRTGCTTSRYHEELIDDVLRDLAAQGIDMDESEVRGVLAARTCPLCGCSVAARTKPAEPSGE